MHGLHRGAPFLSTPLCLYHRVIQLKLLGISKISEGGKKGFFFREAKRSIRVYLVLRFWCFKNFQMPPPKKYDNKILHVGPVDVFWQLTRFFPQNLGEKMSKIWVKKRVNCQKTSSGPICRYYIAILKSSLRDTFLPKIWGKKCPKFG